MISLLEKILLKKRNIKDILITSLDEGNFATYTKYAKYALDKGLITSNDLKRFTHTLRFNTKTRKYDNIPTGNECKEPLHNHHDGCPVCSRIDSAIKIY